MDPQKFPPADQNDQTVSSSQPPQVPLPTPSVQFQSKVPTPPATNNLPPSPSIEKPGVVAPLNTETLISGFPPVQVAPVTPATPQASNPINPPVTFQPQVISPQTSPQQSDIGQSPLPPVITPQMPTPPQPASTQPYLTAATAAQYSAGSNKRHKIKLFSAIGLSAAILIGGAAFGYTRFASGIQLEKQSGKNYSILIPKGYEEKSEQGGALYEETEGDEDSHSGIVIFNQPYPGNSSLDTQQKEAVLVAMEGQIKQMDGTSVVTGTEKAKDVKIERATIKENQGIKFSASLEKDGKIIGRLKGVAVVGEKAFYIVMVAAHESDPGVIKKMDAIINSFEATE